jgi:hypothetical protein
LIFEEDGLPRHFNSFSSHLRKRPSIDLSRRVGHLSFLPGVANTPILAALLS